MQGKCTCQLCNYVNRIWRHVSAVALTARNNTNIEEFSQDFPNNKKMGTLHVQRQHIHEVFSDVNMDVNVIVKQLICHKSKMYSVKLPLSHVLCKYDSKIIKYILVYILTGS